MGIKRSCSNKNAFGIVYNKTVRKAFFIVRREFTYLGRLLAVICLAVFADTCFGGFRDGSVRVGVQNVRGSVTVQNVQEIVAVRGVQGTVEVQNLQEPVAVQSIHEPAVIQVSQAAGRSGERLSGVLQLAGSASMEKVSDAWAESFMEKYPNVKVTVEYIGSGGGIAAAVSGSADIGNSSRIVKEEEKAVGAVENIVAFDGIALCVDPSNTVGNLTSEQLAGIYTGAVRNWSELGGSDTPLVVMGREAGSGTRMSFEEALGLEDKCDYANELNSTGAVMAKIAVTPGAIGYVSADIVDESVLILSLDGVAPTAENIREGSYPLSQPFVMVTKGVVSEQDELVQAWFDYIYSEEGQEIAAQTGLVRVY